MGRCELPCVSQPSPRRGPTEVLISLTLDYWCLLSLQGCREGLLTSNSHPGLANPSCFPHTRQGASMIKSVKDCREKFVSLSRGDLFTQKLRSSVARFLLAAWWMVSTKACSSRGQLTSSADRETCSMYLSGVSKIMKWSSLLLTSAASLLSLLFLLLFAKVPGQVWLPAIWKTFPGSECLYLPELKGAPGPLIFSDRFSHSLPGN